MPRGNIPRQPSKAGRHDKAKTTRAATKPLKISAPKKSKLAPPKPKTAKSPATKAYNPIAPARVTEILKHLDERYPHVRCALHHNSAWEDRKSVV